MNRRSLLWATGATGLLLVMHGPADGSIFGSKPPMEASIERALAARRLMKFKYHGHARLVEPHAVGQVTGNRRALLGWQVSGGSTSEPPPGWRTFVLSEISSLKLMTETFVPRPEYDAATSALKEVEAEVAGSR